MLLNCVLCLKKSKKTQQKTMRHAEMKAKRFHEGTEGLKWLIDNKNLCPSSSHLIEIF